MSTPANTTSLEKLILQSALKAMNRPAPEFTDAGRREMVTSILIGLLIGVGVYLFFWRFADHQIVKAFEPLIGFLIGASFVYIVGMTLSRSQWHFLRSYIDRGGIEARLRELGS